MTKRQLKAYRAGLTRREVEVLDLLAEGLSNKAIASRLIMCEKTVETHVSNIYGKVEVRNRTQAMVWYFSES